MVSDRTEARAAGVYKGIGAITGGVVVVAVVVVATPEAVLASGTAAAVGKVLLIVGMVDTSGRLIHSVPVLVDDDAPLEELEKAAYDATLGATGLTLGGGWLTNRLASQPGNLLHGGKKYINYNLRHIFGRKVVLDRPQVFYSYKNSKFLPRDKTFDPLEIWMTPERLPVDDAIKRLSLPYDSGYDTILKIRLEAGTRILAPRRVWRLFGRPGGGQETRAFTEITPDMYTKLFGR